MLNFARKEENNSEALTDAKCYVLQDGTTGNFWKETGVYVCPNLWLGARQRIAKSRMLMDDCTTP
jgi:hypothetical protein